MRGHIVQRSKYKGTWSIKIATGKDPATGKYKYQWFTVQGNKKDAEKRLSELLHQFDTGALMQPGKTTVADYLNRWLEDYARPNLSPKSFEGYEYILTRYFIPALGTMLLSQLKPEHLQKYYAEKQRGGLSDQTVRHHHTVLHKALKTAMEWGLTNRNVADSVSCPRAQPVEMQTWNEQEVNKFLEVAKTTPYYALFYLALFTGMRRSELLALRWQDIDFIVSEIYVNRSLHVLKGGKVILRSPKTKAGKRTVALPPSAFLVLNEHRKAQEANFLLLDKVLSDTDYVFNNLGEPLLPNTVSHAWIKTVKRNGIKYIRFHDARHTHASLMLKQGIHPKIVQERLGHSSISITLDTYSHVAPGLQEAAAKRFDEAMIIKHNEVVLEKQD
ncbi:MAG: tyrosine-type recombinase/integrase [Dehalococcoidales bacterium]